MSPLPRCNQLVAITVAPKKWKQVKTLSRDKLNFFTFSRDKLIFLTVWRDELNFLTFWRDELIGFDDLRESILHGNLLIRAQSCGLEYHNLTVVITIFTFIVKYHCHNRGHYHGQYYWLNSIIWKICNNIYALPSSSKIFQIPTSLFSCQGSWGGNISVSSWWW